MAATPGAKNHTLELTIDLSGGQEQREPTKFDHLCDNVLSCFVSHGNCLNEFYRLKDELLKHSLPPCLLLQLTLASSRIYRSYSDLSVPLRELARMVKQYAMPWEEKGAVLKKLKADYESKQQQLSIALKHLEMVAAEEERMQHEQRLNNWMRLYSRVMATKSHGRRWKFRIEPFKKKLAEGYNPYGSDSSESEEDEEDEEEMVLLQPSPSSEEEEKEGEEQHDHGSGSEEDSRCELSQALASRLTGGMMKKVRFAALGQTSQPPASPELTTPPEVPPPVKTVEAASWTEEPEYTDHLLVLLYRPRGVLADEEICCTLSLEGQFHSSEVFKPHAEEGEDASCMPFHFLLSDEAARHLSTTTASDDADGGRESPTNVFTPPKLTIAVYPRTIAEAMVAHCSVPLSELHLLGGPTVLVPPNTREGEGKDEEFFINWEQLSAQQQSEHSQSPSEYPLKLTTKMAMKEEGKEEGRDQVEEVPAVLPLICHRVKVQRHKLFHTGTSMTTWSKLLEEGGYKKTGETVSAATSAIALPAKTPTPPPSSPKPKEEEEEGAMTAEQVEALTLSHVEEMKQLQQQYEKKLEMLSHTLARVRNEKEKQIEQLEQALVESEAVKRRKQKSSDIRSLLARRQRPKLHHGLPVWGKDLPKNFFERLELFAEESLQKHQELTERIRREVQETCEKQLALQHKLAPTVTSNIYASMEDVCLPALFMPSSSSSRALVYNPRAHSYFHPPGSLQARITQPPSILKLPSVQKNQLATLNLYDLTHNNTAQTGPTWLRADQYASPRYTPAPPPSACDFYQQQQQRQLSASHQRGLSPLPLSGRSSRLGTS